MGKKEFINAEQKRAGILNIFSALFCQPEEELIRNKNTFEALKLYFETVNPDCIDSVQRMQKSTKRYSTQDLLIEYARLFIGPFQVQAPPYSSLYLGDNLIMSGQTMWVLDFYRKAGLAFDSKIKDLPDHIAIETEFLYYLIYNEINELKTGNIKSAQKFHVLQVHFINNHYKIWVPIFCEKILEKSTNDFFRALATCFEKFVRTWVISDYLK
ncbi:hypothetical protein MNBD_BACTEROID01-1714 [hydrothermal vent metagenome]|uniref:Oxidoreductase component of anaerobic dehydrogenases Chaperone protein TorD n=1 Tax=hydrothermal vent metagenome TaxID=652676 RepID=A0A3B0UV90_9ZZZZ